MPDEQIAALLEHGEEQGCLNLSEFSEFVQTNELDEEQLSQLYEELDARHIDLTDDCARRETESEPTIVNGDLAVATTDALQLFLNEAAKWPLLTADEEVELAKRIERGAARGGGGGAREADRARRSRGEGADDQLQPAARRLDRQALSGP